jgi:pimeloyl-ACP methyl ester carboxylesterase
VALATTAAAGGATLPAKDPFYTVPSGLKHLANGTILKSRHVTASAAGLPLHVSAWQLEYKTLDVNNKPTAMVTTLLVPTAPWTGKGARPVVSYQFAEDGASTACAPSYALTGGTASLETESNASTETQLLDPLLKEGWALAIPDYEGPGSYFFSAAEEAHGVLDGIKAALHFKAAGFSNKNPVAMMGYSGGGYATAVAALYQAKYAPKLHLTAAAIGSPAVSVTAELKAFSGGIGGGAIAMAIAALERAYPKANLGQYLNAAGKSAVEESSQACLIQAAEEHPFASISQWEATPDALQKPAVTSFLDSISPEFMPGHPIVPVLEYHDQADEFAPIGPALATVGKWCARGARVDQVTKPGGEHIEFESVGQPIAIDYLAARFAGHSTPDTCPHK